MKRTDQDLSPQGNRELKRRKSDSRPPWLVERDDVPRPTRPVSSRVRTINDAAVRDFLCEKETGSAKSEIVEHCRDEFPEEKLCKSPG